MITSTQFNGQFCISSFLIKKLLLLLNNKHTKKILFVIGTYNKIILYIYKYIVTQLRLRDLFHKAILQSGAALDPWADECDHSAVQIAKIHDPSISTEKEALKLFKNLSVDELYQLQVAFLEVRTFKTVHNLLNNDYFVTLFQKIEIGATRPFGLVIEPVSKKTAFLTKKPIDIISSGGYNKVPMIFGYNSMEGNL